MRIVVDENVDSFLVNALKREGYWVSWISKDNPSIDDAKVLHFSFEQNALLITEDKGFGEKVFRDSQSTSGVLLLRIHNVTFDIRAEMVTNAIIENGENLIGKFSVINNRKLRIRMV